MYPNFGTSKHNTEDDEILHDNKDVHVHNNLQIATNNNVAIKKTTGSDVIQHLDHLEKMR